jgi:peptidoglycan hydrolase CwlO-like protein
MRKRGVALVLAAIVLIAAPATASTGHRRLARARAERASALAQLAELRTRLDVLMARYAVVERAAGRAALELAAANHAVELAQQAVGDAQRALDRRARTVYEVGPTGVIQALLSARSFADIASANEFTARALAEDATAVRAKEQAQAELEVRRATVAQVRETLATKQTAMASLLITMRGMVARAEQVAARANVVVAGLERQQRALEEAARREAGRNLIVGGASGIDQSRLLALLGPSGGRMCQTPAGLRDTGKRFRGLATWYGWEFAGQTTASGAVFDPRLFTTANRWLPFGSFVRVRYDGKCAIVLVNDRGPFGDPHRVLDLSMAAAQYLGVGVTSVRADVLVPRAGASG